MERIVAGINLWQSGGIVGHLIVTRANALAQGKAFPGR
jgi:hypothetical protein